MGILAHEYFLEKFRQAEHKKKGIHLIKIKYLQSCDGHSEGQINEYTPDFAKLHVEEGIAQYVDENTPLTFPVEHPTFPVEKKSVTNKKEGDKNDMTRYDVKEKYSSIPCNQISMEKCDINDEKTAKKEEKKPITAMCVSPVTCNPDNFVTENGYQVFKVTGYKPLTGDVFQKVPVETYPKKNLKFSPQEADLFTNILGNKNNNFLLLSHLYLSESRIKYEDLFQKCKLNENAFKQCIFRLKENKEIYKEKEKNDVFILITPLGMQEVETAWQNYCQHIKALREQINVAQRNQTQITEKIDAFKDFFQLHYEQDIMQSIIKSKNYINMDFQLLSRYSSDLAQYLLDEPDECFKIMDLATSYYTEVYAKNKKITIRPFNIPSTNIIKINDIRIEHLGKLLCIEGNIQQKSPICAKTNICVFECPSCGMIYKIIQTDKKLKELYSCSCGRKGKLNLRETIKTDYREMVLQSIYDESNLNNLSTVVVTVEGKLVEECEIIDHGHKVTVVGYIYSESKQIREGGKSRLSEFLIDAKYINSSEEKISLELTTQDIQEFQQLAKNKDFDKIFFDSFLSDIHKMENIKKAIALSILKGVMKKREDGTFTRAEIHLLLIGDPGKGKSTIMLSGMKVCPKARMASGTGSSGVGLTASAIKNERIGRFALEYGILLQAHGGLLFFDEIEKMPKEDLMKFLDAMAKGYVFINKAGINATLLALVSIIAAGNPKHGRFDPYKSLMSQIDLPAPLINRFDLIFPIRDTPNEEEDKERANFILKLHSGLLNNKENKEFLEPLKIRKYLYYASKLRPKLSQEGKEEIIQWYVKNRNSMKSSDDNKFKPITSLNERQLEGIIRLSEAWSKLHLRDEVTKEDVKNAIGLLTACLKDVGYDPISNELNANFGNETTQKGIQILNEVKDCIITLSKSAEGNLVYVPKLLEFTATKLLNEKSVIECIALLTKQGDIYSPKPDYLKMNK